MLLPSPPRLLHLRLRVPCRKSLQTRGHKSTRPRTTPKRSGRTRQIHNQIQIPIPFLYHKDLCHLGFHHCHHRYQLHQGCHHRHHHYQVHQECHHHQNLEPLLSQECHHRHHHCLDHQGCHHHRSHYLTHQECHHCHHRYPVPM